METIVVGILQDQYLLSLCEGVFAVDTLIFVGLSSLNQGKLTYRSLECVGHVRRISYKQVTYFLNCLLIDRSTNASFT